jgi:SAM-dependent methyltransferase
MGLPSSSDQRRLYNDLAWTWPIISPPEEYVRETEEFCKIIREHSQIGTKTLLNLGCGGGHHDNTLKRYFEVTGVDVSEAMLGLARRLNPEVTYLVGDMRTLRLGKLFDAVAVFDSLAYMLTEDDLLAAFTTAFVHLKPGGVFCTYVEQSRERFRQNKTRYSTHAQDDIEITFVENSYDPDPTDTTYESTFVYLIRRGGHLQIETDKHLCGIFALGTWHGLLKEVGLEVTQRKFRDPSLEGGSCPMLVCLKPP